METVRDSFFNTIFKLIEQGEDIVVVTSDLGAPSLDDLRKYYPERYVSVGIAEQSLVSISAGIALAGHKVIAYGLSPFPITRAYDQLRSVTTELNVPITFCGLNAGLCSAEAGYTHMPIDDIAMLRMLPKLRTFNPTDETIAKKLAMETVQLSYPRFIRFDKVLRGNLYSEDAVDLSCGFVLNRSGMDEQNLLMISFGCYIPELQELIRSYKEKDVALDLVDLFAMPADKESLANLIAQYRHVVTIEENLLMGGLGSYILELLSDYGITAPVKRLGLIAEKFPYRVLANRDYIRRDQGIDMKSIEEEINKLIR